MTVYICDPCQVQWRQAPNDTATTRACWMCGSITTGRMVAGDVRPKKPPSLFRRVA